MRAVVGLLLWALCWAPRSAHALPPPAVSDRDGWAWTAVPVYRDVDPDRLQAAPPFVPPGTATAPGTAVAGPGRGVVFWIPALSTVRLRKTKPRDGATPRFRRLQTGTGEGYALLDEPGLAAEDGSWLLTQPPGGSGAAWIVDADVPTEITVQLPKPRRSRRIWEHVEERVLASIDDGSTPTIPPVEGQGELAARLAANTEVVRAVAQLPGGDTPEVGAALVAWQKAAALLQLWRVRPLSRPYFAHRRYKPLGHDPVRIPDLARGHRRLLDGRIDEYYAVEGEARWVFSERGPGIVRIDARQLMRPTDDARRVVRITVVADGRRLGEVTEKVSAARVRSAATTGAPIPAFDPLRTASGAPMSRRVTLSIPLPPGARDYEIRLEGVDLARVKIARRVPRTTRAGPNHTVGGILRHGRKRLGTNDSLGARVARALLEHVEGRAGRLAAEDHDALHAAGASALAHRLALHDTAPIERSDDERVAAARPVLAFLRTQTTGPMSAQELDLRRRLFDLYFGARRADLWIAAIHPRVRQLDVDTFSKVALAVDDATQTELLPGLLDFVVRGVPLHGGLRRGYLHLWKRMRWSQLRPDDAPAKWTFIDPKPATPMLAEPKDAPPTSWRMPTKRAITIDVPASPDPVRPLTVLEIVTEQSPQPDGAWTVSVDGTDWHTLALSHADLFEIALPPGPHTIEAHGPQQSRAFAFLPRRVGPGSARDAAIRTTGFAVRARSLTVPISPGPAGALVRLDLRLAGGALNTAAPAIRVTLSGTGTEGRTVVRTMEYRAGARDSEVLAIGGPQHATSRVSVVVPVDPETTELIVQPEAAGDATVVAAVSVRRWAGPVLDPQAPPNAPVAAAWVPPEDPYAEIAAASRALEQRPRDAALLLRRANLLLDVGYTEFARGDYERAHDRLASGGRPQLLARLRQVAKRMSVANSDRYIALPEESDAPRLLGPPLATLGLTPDALEPHQRGSEQARAGTLGGGHEETGPPGDNVDTVLRAAAHEVRGAWVEAARAWAQLYGATGDWRFARASAKALVTAPAGAALAKVQPMAFGVATVLQEHVNSPFARRLQTSTAQGTRWRKLANAEQTASIDRLRVSVARGQGSRLSKVLRALLAPPWPDDDFVLIRPGRQGVIEVTAGRRREATVDVRCVATRTSSDAPVPVSMGVDGTEAETVSVEPGVTATRKLSVPAGRRRLVVALDVRHHASVCGARYAWSDGVALGAERQRIWWGAHPRGPASAIVAGPTSLRVRARSLGAVDSGDTLDVVARGLRHKTVTTTTVSLPAGRDPLVSGRRKVGRVAEAIVILPDAGPYQIELTPRSARVLLEVSMREGTPAQPDPAQVDDPPRTASAEGLWPPTPYEVTPPGVHDSKILTANRFGTPFFEGRFFRDDIADNDDFRPRNNARITGGARRVLAAGHAWARLRGHAQFRDQSGSAGGGDVALFGQLHPRRLRAVLRGAAWGEKFAGRRAYGLRTEMTLDRPITVSPATTLIPGLVAIYRYQSLRESAVGTTLESTHPQVYNRYAEQHPLLTTPGVTVRYRPLQDLSAAAYTSVTLNSDFAALDHIDVGGRVRGLVDTPEPVLFLYRIGYEASPRFVDENRSTGFVRNRIDGGVGVVVPIVGAGRLLVEVRDSVYLTGVFPARNSILISLGFEAASGRGVQDLAPSELEFRDAHEQLWWESAQQEDLL